MKMKQQYGRVNTLLLLAAMWLASFQGATAQTLNERWHATWYSGKERLTINAATFDNCRWVGSAPKSGEKGCVAFYAGTLARAEMLRTLQAVEKLGKAAKAPQEELRALDAEVRMARETLESVSDETFRVVRLFDSSEGGSGDCDGVFFLDKTSVYRLTWCIRELPGITATRFFKR